MKIEVNLVVCSDDFERMRNKGGYHTRNKPCNHGRDAIAFSSFVQCIVKPSKASLLVTSG